jgi:hypothetical protein
MILRLLITGGDAGLSLAVPAGEENCASSAGCLIFRAASVECFLLSAFC